MKRQIMSKFVIECPQCGKFAETKTGFFARKKFDCPCGYTIDVHTDKLTSTYGQMGSNGGGGALGDIAGLGVTLGAMSGIMGMTKEAMAPMFGGQSQNTAPQLQQRLLHRGVSAGTASVGRKALPETSVPTA